MAMYIRVKRNRITYFIQCDPTETILQIKEKLYNLTDQPVNDQQLILLPAGDVLEDSKSLADQKLKKNKHFQWCFRGNGGRKFATWYNRDGPGKPEFACDIAAATPPL
ncbi:PREDICTED: uncharacterized protein LOC109221196 [Nicotiana attenuata]|uniref:uncharacterized protein LOC109221196 n=1 Tax=Nicotiana attenuata TaxID=49451 RepID=UPI000905BD85|nr:PREDICTED: uncharacterized protein LOC109221196 [Nicotiana attenuata]